MKLTVPASLQGRVYGIHQGAPHLAGNFLDPLNDFGKTRGVPEVVIQGTLNSAGPLECKMGFLRSRSA